MYYCANRTWSQWFFMRWVIGACVRFPNTISDSTTKYLKFKTTRWFLFAYIHMLWISFSLGNKYHGCIVDTWLDWESKK